MKYYKAFDENLKCRDFQYEVGKEYEIEGEPVICQRGFHFCETIADCYEYYPKNDATRICEVEPLGEVVKNKNKSCTNRIRIVRELPKEEHKNGNVGSDNVGYSNKGDCNIGNDNVGDDNEGNYNVGDYNVGNCNKGDYNEGDDNRGNYNVGNCNKGNYNDGNYNEGNFNEGNYNEGTSNKGNHNKGDNNGGIYNVGNSNVGNSNYGDFNEGDSNIGIRNKGEFQVGICNTNAPLVMFNKVSKMTLKELVASGALDDIRCGTLTPRVLAIDVFDINVWNEIFGTDYKE